MMSLILPKSWKEDFAAAVAERREDLRWKEKIAVNEAMERQRAAEEKAEEARKDALTDELIAFALATPHDVAAFRVTLDDYDTATVEVLMDNDEALRAVRQKIDAMLEDAYVLPDGRRVFKTKDGQQVFDEHGQQLSPDIIDPDSIDDRKTKWETFKAATDEGERLMRERNEVLDYQRKLDEARDRLDKGDITRKELKDIEASLAADMPDAVREKLGLENPALDTPATTADQKQDADHRQSSLPSQMDRLVQQSGWSPAASS